MTGEKVGANEGVFLVIALCRHSTKKIPVTPSLATKPRTYSIETDEWISSSHLLQNTLDLSKNKYLIGYSIFWMELQYLEWKTGSHSNLISFCAISEHLS